MIGIWEAAETAIQTATKTTIAMYMTTITSVNFRDMELRTLHHQMRAADFQILKHRPLGKEAQIPAKVAPTATRTAGNSTIYLKLARAPAMPTATKDVTFTTTTGVKLRRTRTTMQLTAHRTPATIKIPWVTRDHLISRQRARMTTTEELHHRLKDRCETQREDLRTSRAICRSSIITMRPR